MIGNLILYQTVLQTMSEPRSDQNEKSSPQNKQHPQDSVLPPSIFEDPEKHKCSFCHVPLKSLTKIFAICESDLKKSQQTVQPQILCVSCLAGWSSQKIDVDQMPKLNYKFWISRSLNKKIQIDEQQHLTASQCLELLSCAEKFGPHVNSRFTAQFKEKTGSNLSQKKIEELYIKMRSCLFDTQADLSFQYPPQAIQKLKENEIVEIPKSFNLLQGLTIKRQEEKLAKLFFNILQYPNSVQKYRKYPDNHSEYLYRAFSMNDVSKQILIQNNPKNTEQINQKNTLLHIIRQQVQQKDKKQKFHQTLHKKYCYKYIQMRRLVKSQIPQQDKQSKLLYNLTHPEFSKLLENQQLNGILTSIVSLNKQRKQIMEQVKERKKAIANLRRKESRQNKKMNKSAQIQQRRERSRDEKCVREKQASD